MSIVRLFKLNFVFTHYLLVMQSKIMRALKTLESGLSLGRCALSGTFNRWRVIPSAVLFCLIGIELS